MNGNASASSIHDQHPLLRRDECDGHGVRELLKLMNGRE